MLMQRRYVKMIPTRFNMIDCHLVATPVEKRIWLQSDMNLGHIDNTKYLNIVGNCLIFFTNIRPNILFIVSCVS